MVGDFTECNTIGKVKCSTKTRICLVKEQLCRTIYLPLRGGGRCDFTECNTIGRVKRSTKTRICLVYTDFYGSTVKVLNPCASIFVVDCPGRCCTEEKDCTEVSTIFEDDFRTGCQNVHLNQQQSF